MAPTPTDVTPPEETCVGLIEEAFSQAEGVAGVDLDTDARRLAVRYDSRQISSPRLNQLVQQVDSDLQRNLETCTWRLNRRGGRLCESCALSLEDRVRELQGVRKAAASYRGGVLSVTFDHTLISPDELTKSVRRLGAPVAPSQPAVPDETAEHAWQRRVRSALEGQRLEVLLTAVAFVTMVAGWLAERTAAPLWASPLFFVSYLTGGTFGLKAGIESLREGRLDIDLLMILAAVGAAYVGAPFEGAMLLFLFSLSNVLQAYALGRTRSAIRALMALRPNQARIRKGEGWVDLPIDEVALGDRYLVRPGDRIPLDGRVVAGESAVDQAPITGESLPVPRRPGDLLLAGTINKNGSLEAEVTRLAGDSTIARLIQLVEEAQSEKARTQRFLDRAEQYYAMGVVTFTALAIVVPVLIFEQPFQPAFYRAMTLMVAASPCALVISTPAAILSAIGNGARNGALFKGGAYIEQAAQIEVVAFDKTGTLTEGKPRVTDVFVLPPQPDEARDPGRWHGDEDALLALVAAVESRSEHVLAQATVNEAHTRALDFEEAITFQAMAGMGVQGKIDGRTVRIGNLRYFESMRCAGLKAATRETERLHREGKTTIVVAQIHDGGQTATLLGGISFADRLRPDAARTVHELKSLGVSRVVMLTGDDERIAHAIAAQTGVDAYYANLLPEDKVRLVRELEESHGAVAMVGDGVNDAPALASATIGIAMGAAGTDVALETADVVLMSDDLGNLPYVIALSRQTRRTLGINLAFAAGMIALMIAAIFAVDLSLPLAVVGHEGGTVLVSLNGLRLLFFRRKPSN